MKLKVSQTPPYDPYQCFVRENHIALDHLEDGPLSGLVFSAKDVFEVKGSKYSNGNPTWLQTQKVSLNTATAITKLLFNGADLVGKTICDELCYSISGENWHYGSPIHPIDPMRYAGGSSSGSAVSVASGLVDFSIGSDCLGSVRVPASYTGCFGFRPSYQRVDNTGEAPYCPSMDVLGWMAYTQENFEKVSQVLLGEDKKEFNLTKVIAYPGYFKDIESWNIDDSDWVETFRHVQGYEVNQSYREWIELYKPYIHPGPQERLDWAKTITLEQYEQGLQRKKEILEEFQTLLGNDTVLVLPTASSVAIHRKASHQEVNQIRAESSKLLCISPLTNTPQITLPIHSIDGLPFGISFIGPEGSDLALLRFATELTKTIEQSLL